MILGKNLKIYLGDTPVACSTSCIVNIDVDLIEVSGSNSSTSKEFLPKRTSWNINVSGLLARGIADDMIGNISETLHATFTDGNVLYEGDVYIKKLQFKGNVKQLAQYSAELQGTGDLTPVTD